MQQLYFDCKFVYQIYYVVKALDFRLVYISYYKSVTIIYRGIDLIS